MAERARAAGDQAGEALAYLLAAQKRLDADDPDVDELERSARAALPLLEQAADDAGLGRVWAALGSVASFRGQFGECVHAGEQAVRHLRLAGQQPSAGLNPLVAALVLGPRPADEALRTLDLVDPENPHPGAVLCRAVLLAMLGRFEEAWALALPAGERWRELTSDARGDFRLGEIAALAGDHTTAAAYLRGACDVMERRGYQGLLSTYAPMLGRSLCALGRYDEAEPLARLGRELGSEQDYATQMLWRQVQAGVQAHHGEHAQAEQLAREAVAIGEQTDALNAQGDALCDLAEVLAAAGRSDEAAAALEPALERYKRKKNLAMASQVHRRFDALDKAAPA